MSNRDDIEVNLPVVEIFQSIEGEGMKAGFLTTFIRLFGCNLNCNWCDTTYSRKPYAPRYNLTVAEIVTRVARFKNKHICLTGGEPLLHGEAASLLIRNLSKLDFVDDIHIETNGSLDLKPFTQLREENPFIDQKVRFIMDYKLPSSGEMEKMVLKNFTLLQDRDEIKFVVADDQDFDTAKEVLHNWHIKGYPLFGAVWDRMPLQRLAGLLIDHKLQNAKLNVQLHKVIWGDQQGV